MRAPEQISGADFTELGNILKEHPYFQNGHFVVARAGRKLKTQSASKALSTAATYATNRNLFKAYIQGQIKFQEIAPSTNQNAPIIVKDQIASNPKEISTPEEETSPLIKELYENLGKWKDSRAQYLDYDKAHPDEIVIESSESASTQIVSEENVVEPTPKKENEAFDQVEQLKNQVEEEILAEEQSISKALSDLSSKPKDLTGNNDHLENTDSLASVEPTSPVDGSSADNIEIESKNIEEQTTESTTISADELSSLVDADTSEVQTATTAPESNPSNTDEKKEISADELSSLVDEIVEKDTSEEIENTKNKTTEASAEELTASVDHTELEEVTPTPKEDTKQAPEPLNISADELSSLVDEIVEKDTSADIEDTKKESIEVSAEELTALVDHAEQEEIPSLPEEETKQPIESVEISTDALTSLVDEIGEKDTSKQIEDARKESTEEVSTDELTPLVDHVESEETIALVNKETKQSSDSFEISADELSAIVDQEAGDDISKETQEKSPKDAIEDAVKEEKSNPSIEGNLTNDPKSIIEHRSEESVKDETKIEKENQIEESDLKSDQPAALVNIEPKESKAILAETEEDITHKTTPITESPVLDEIELNIEPSDRSIKENEEALDQLDQEKQGLKLTPLSSTTQGKKFRLSTLKHGVPFTKPRARKHAKNSDDVAASKLDEKKEVKATSKKDATPKAKTPKKSTGKKKPDPDNDKKTKSEKKSIKSKTKGDNVEKKKINQTDLIDKFIEARPTIKVDKDAPSNIVDFSANSEAFPDHIISENLATILLNQGKTELAITIYKKLCKKHPLNQNMYKLKIKALKNDLNG